MQYMHPSCHFGVSLLCDGSLVRGMPIMAALEIARTLFELAALSEICASCTIFAL